MPDVSFVNLLVVVAVAVAAPLAVGYLSWLRIPAVVLEIVGGIIIGPSVGNAGHGVPDQVSVRA